MANVTSGFTGNRTKFLTTYIVFAPEPKDKGSGPRTFWFDEVGGTVTLKAGAPGASDADQTVVNAYWLSWEKKKAVPLDIGNAADYFFTSQMTGCRFKVLTKGAQNPKVAHIAGDLSKTDRNAAETKLLDAIPEANRATGRERRLSVGEGRTHGYTGQTDGAGEDGSAFVYGFKDASNNWTFEAQIVKATLADAFAYKILVQKSGVPRIAPLYEFH